MAQRLEFTIPPEVAGTRLDRCLSRLIPDSSRAYLQKLIKSGAVRCDGVACTVPRQPVAGGMRIEVDMPETAGTESIPTAEPFAFDRPVWNASFTRSSDGTLFVHFPNGLLASGFDIPIAQQPKSVTLLNNGETLQATVELMPSHALDGKPDLHITGIDAEKLLNTVPVIKICWQ